MGAPKGESGKEEGTAEEDTTCSVLPSRIGGPGTSLPFVAESFLGWSLCFSCLAVSGYHYCKSILFPPGWCYSVYRRARTLVRGLMGGWILRLVRPSRAHHCPVPEECATEATWIPLTTHSRAELDGQSPWERYISLVRYLEMRHPEVLTPMIAMQPEETRGRMGSISERSLPSMKDLLSVKCNADAALVRALRRDDICRRLASLAMRPYDASQFEGTPAPMHRGSRPTTLLRQFPHNRLLQRMSKLWKHALVLPSLDECTSYYRLPSDATVPVASARCKHHQNDANYPYRISLIFPAYREKGSHLMSKLSNALEMAAEPNEVEVVVVDAGGCSDLETLLSLAEGSGTANGRGQANTRCWGQVALFSFVSGGGRGPCLNFGGSVATGRILTCCHSDTTLPRDWDDRIVTALERDGRGSARANSCAFSFGIDTTPEGLSMPFESSASAYYPPGIKAVEITANIRSRFFSLPYGDSVLSLHARIFEFLGGFPDQCLMEDYELVALLRRRAALFAPPSELLAPGSGTKEKVAIIPGTPALCSPRRWQKLGVLYVTYANSKFVNLYAGATRMIPDDLFQLYYGREPPKRDASASPWERRLANTLES